MRCSRWQFEINAMIGTEALDGQGSQTLRGCHGTPQNTASFLLHRDPMFRCADSKSLVNLIF